MPASIKSRRSALKSASGRRPGAPAILCSVMKTPFGSATVSTRKGFIAARALAVATLRRCRIYIALRYCEVRKGS